MKLLTYLVAIALAPQAVAAEIDPTDGTWIAQVGAFSTSGCPAQVAQQLQNAGPQQSDATFELVWDGTPQVGDYAWNKVGENRFRAVQANNEVTQMGTIAMQSVLNLTVVSQTQMTQDGVTTITLSGQLADAFGSTDGCQLNHQVMYLFQG